MWGIVIVHFTRASVGTAYLRAAARFESRTGVPVMTVLSTRRLPGEAPEATGPADLAKGFARRLLGKDGLGGRRGRVVRAANVNAPEFLATLPSGAHGVVTYFDQIFRPAAIARFASLVNLHCSVLPAYRGLRPTADVIANEETSTGMTLHEITPEIDAGPIRYQTSFAIPPGTGVGALDDLSIEHGVPIFERWLEHLAGRAAWNDVVLDVDRVYRSREYAAASE